MSNVIYYDEKFAELIAPIQSGYATDKQLKTFEKLREWMLNWMKIMEGNNNETQK